MTNINKEKESLITQVQLKEMLDYNKDTGKFIWRTPRGNNKIKAGDIAGSITSKGYGVIKYNGKIYLVHRLVWLYVYGQFPTSPLDHINCDKADNRLCNLREASYKQNSHNINKRKSCSSKYKGIHWDKNRQMWRARIVIDGKPRCLGFYTTEGDAHCVWCNFAEEHHKEFVNLGVARPIKELTVKEKYAKSI